MTILMLEKPGKQFGGRAELKSLICPNKVKADS